MQTSFNFNQVQSKQRIDDGAYWLQGFCLSIADELWQAVQAHIENYPPSTMMTPMGYPMSVKTTSFGDVGWIGEVGGYGYSNKDINTQKAWPPIPSLLMNLAVRAAHEAGYAQFSPDTCLVNLYAVGAKMGLHQDKDEQDFSQPIVSVSLGLPATFIFGGPLRSSPARKIPVTHGDVVVWGGKSRRFYHGVNTIRDGMHPQLGALRCNLTFRKAR